MISGKNYTKQIKSNFFSDLKEVVFSDNLLPLLSYLFSSYDAETLRVNYPSLLDSSLQQTGHDCAEIQLVELLRNLNLTRRSSGGFYTHEHVCKFSISNWS